MRRNRGVASQHPLFQRNPKKIKPALRLGKPSNAAYLAFAASSATYSQFTKFSTNALR